MRCSKENHCVNLCYCRKRLTKIRTLWRSMRSLRKRGATRKNCTSMTRITKLKKLSNQTCCQGRKWVFRNLLFSKITCKEWTQKMGETKVKCSLEIEHKPVIADFIWELEIIQPTMRPTLTLSIWHHQIYDSRIIQLTRDKMKIIIYRSQKLTLRQIISIIR